MIDHAIELPRRDSEYIRSLDAPQEEHESMLAWLGRNKKAAAIVALTVAAGGLAVSPQARAWALSALSALGKRAWSTVQPWLISLGTSLYGLLPRSTRMTIDGFFSALALGEKGATTLQTVGESIGTASVAAAEGIQSAMQQANVLGKGMREVASAMLGIRTAAPVSFADIASDLAGASATGVAKTLSPAKEDTGFLKRLSTMVQEFTPGILQWWGEKP